MKFIEGVDGKPHKIELTRRNLEILLAKLDDPLSARTLIDPDWEILVKAQEEEHPVGDGMLASEKIVVTAVENDEHYKTRQPGPMYMPSTGETL